MWSRPYLVLADAGTLGESSLERFLERRACLVIKQAREVCPGARQAEGEA